MNITLHIEAGNPAELQEAIAGLAGIVTGAVATRTEPEKTKRTSKETPKPEKQPDPETVKGPETSEDAAEETTATETEEIPTVVDLRAKAQEKGATPEGKKAIKALLDKFESKSISDVPEEKRVAFLRELEALKA